MNITEEEIMGGHTASPAAALSGITQVLRSNAPQRFYWFFVAPRHLLFRIAPNFPKLPQNLADQRVRNDAHTKAIELGVPKYGPRQGAAISGQWCTQ